MVDHLRDAAPRASRVVGTVRVSHAREKQPQVIVDFRHRADGGRGLWDVAFCSIAIAGESPSIRSKSGFSINCRNWRRVGGERLDVAPLALGIEGVEREGGFAGAGDPVDHDKAVAWDVEGHS